VLLQPLPIADADHVVIIWPRDKQQITTVGEISHWTFRVWQRQAQSFESLAAIGSVNWTLVLRDGGEPATVPVAAVSASFFSLVRTPAALGRALLPEDDRRGSARVAVVAHNSWVRRFGADPHIIGRRLVLSGMGYTAVGVMPEGFEYPRGAELWVPVIPQLADASNKWGVDTLETPSFGVLFLLGRLKQGVTIRQAEAELSSFVTRNEGAAFMPGMNAAVTPIREHILGNNRVALRAVTVGVGLVLLIACANVAIVLLVREDTRALETAIRIAIGATRWRIVRLSLADALSLAGLGGIAGLLIAWWIIRLIVTLAPSDAPRLDAVRLNGRALLFASIACLAAALLAGLIPGLHAARANIVESLNAGSVRLTRSHVLQRFVVAAQIAFGMTLLVAAGLVGQSFINLLRLDFGFASKNVLTLEITLPDAPTPRRSAFYSDLLARVRQIPGVDSAAAIFLRPLEHTAIGNDATFLIEGQRIGPQFRDDQKNPRTNFESVTADYFRTMGIRVLRGREFTDADTARGAQVVMVSEALAERLWPRTDPIGKRVLRPGAPRDAGGELVWSTVVGVAENVRYRGLTDIRFDLYVPYLQNPNDDVKHVMVRTTLDPLSLAPAVRAEAKRLEPMALVESVTTMDALVGQAMAPWRFSAVTLGLLSVLALALVLLGVYGTVSQSVIERAPEIGIRVALGAQPRDILRLVLGEGLRTILGGIVLGLACAIGASRFLAGLLFGVRPADPITLAAMAMLFVVASVLAMLIPTRHVLRVARL
jgi:putative ABC transport system permease protein